LVGASGPELAVGIIAVTASATCAPLNPAYRASEYDFYLSDLGVDALVIQKGVESAARSVAAARGIRIIELSPTPEGPAGRFTLSGAGRTGPARPGVAQPDDVALLLHTSGTTSRPKIVPLTQANVSASADDIRDALG